MELACSGAERGRNLLQRVGEPFATRFQVRLLAGPGAEKGDELVRRADGAEPGAIGLGKDPRGQLEQVGVGLDALDVDAHTGPCRDGEGHDVAGMGEVELNRLVPGQDGPAGGGVGELDRVRRQPEMMAEALADQGAADDEAGRGPRRT